MPLHKTKSGSGSNSKDEDPIQDENTGWKSNPGWKYRMEIKYRMKIQDENQIQDDFMFDQTPIDPAITKYACMLFCFDASAAPAEPWCPYQTRSKRENREIRGIFKMISGLITDPSDGDYRRNTKS